MPLDLDLLVNSLSRIEARQLTDSEKLDKVVADVGELKVSHARLEEKFRAHDEAEAARVAARKDVRMGLKWPLVIASVSALIGALAASWTPAFVRAAQAERPPAALAAPSPGHPGGGSP